MTYTQHPLSAAFPAMSADDMQALKDDIEVSGQREPIVLFEGQVIDGWHRYQACTSLMLPVKSIELQADEDPVAFVKSLNLLRRHLTASQRAASVVACSEWHPAHRLEKKGAPGAPLSNAQMASDAKVSVRTIHQAKVAHSAGLGESVRDGVLSVKQAEQMARGVEAPRPQPKPAAPADDDFDPLEELSRAAKDIETLTALVKAAEADDTKAEVVKWRRAYDAAVRGQSEAMDRAKEATDREAWSMRQLRRCGKAVGQDDPTKIAAAVEAVMRERKAVAA